MNLESYRLLTRPEYFRELADWAAAAGPGDHMTLSTMSFGPADKLVAPLLDELKAAARRGVRVHFLVDAYPLLIHGGTRPGPLFWRQEMPARLGRPFRLVNQAISELRRSGVQVTMLNRPSRAFTVPIAGRSHIKFAVINDRVYIGGCNLDHFNKVDIMLAWDDKNTAQWLRQLAGEMAGTGQVQEACGGRDLTHRLSETETLLVDAGVPGRSLIYERALQLIDEATERVFIACQFFPGGRTGEHLLKAERRGVKVEILFNHPSKHNFPHNILHHFVTSKERTRLPASYFVQSLRRGQPMLHAKLIVTERAAILGSHNFVEAGVKLGTAEIAILGNGIDWGEKARQLILDESMVGRVV